ncbi:DUF4959 domain-containing protein [Butyricimonas paravirosa]
MRNTILILLFIFGVFACSDDKSVFNVDVPESAFLFKARPGGAVMHYKLPDDSDIFSLNVRYVNAQGKDVLKVGSYVGDSLLMDGFNEARQNVPARITFVNNQRVESAPLDVMFDTEDSAPYAFFKEVQVSPSWGGFQVMYNTPEIVTGMVHVFYLGTNPLTQQEDTVLLKSFPINMGGDTLQFTLQQERLKNTVIIRTDDYRGYRVRQEVWKDVEAYFTEKLPITEDNYDDGGLSMEREDAKTSVKYLFDGERKGLDRLRYLLADPNNKDECYTYLAGPYALGKPVIIDLKEEKIPAFIRIYSMLPMSKSFNYGSGALYAVWSGFYNDKLPCDVTIYAGNEKDPDSDSWVKMGSLYESPSLAQADRWTHPYEHYTTKVYSEAEIEAADEIYVDIKFLATPQKYRYIKMVVNDTYDPTTSRNTNEGDYFTMHELEVYVKKD